MRAAALALLAALPAAGCITWKDATVPLEEPVEIEADGTWRHEPSGVEFPEEVGGWVRVAVTRYDVDGLDVSVGYDSRNRSFPMSATVYVYPAPVISSSLASDAKVLYVKKLLAHDEVERRKAEILGRAERRGSECRVVSERIARVENGGAVFLGTRVAFDVGDVMGQKGIDGVTLLYLFPWVHDRWIVKFRVSYPAVIAPGDSIDVLLRDIPWSAAGRATPESLPAPTQLP